MRRVACLSSRVTEALGWFSSLVLVLTISRQVYRQWRAGTSRGVSQWLFIGQATASAGFTAYSALVHNWVFVVTNALMLASALTGWGIVLHHSRRELRAGVPLSGDERATPSFPLRSATDALR